ncbi:Putative L,D-transpeptidase YkuD [Limihaloglobus sulfuriphilus]|uniref:Putative L,D-transpeptidase YkuD n=1 Tax=Limihaloglobus sulfuriphilus TaxID=1851148 RepID=A0A1Q2MEV3_9BACT|nr:L,D-transpeptidase family protein [Limihaloglobus sulfuriphilus]AQQ71231.1 Putative L,D-transpeptidase YkuD [Limihaloglobus sulfuriphilus]
MAARRYTTYKSRKKKTGNLKYFVIAILGIVAIFFFLPMFWGSDEQPESQPQPQPPAQPEFPEPPIRSRATLPGSSAAESRNEQPQNNTGEPAANAEKTDSSEETLQPDPKADKPLTEEQQIQKRINELMADANKDIETGRIIAARYKLSNLLYKQLDPHSEAAVKKHLEMLSDLWLFSGKTYEDDNLCTVYTVKSGDNLTRIGSIHNVPWEIIAELNGISRPESIRVGQKLKVPQGPFHAIINLSTMKMDLYLQQTYVKTYEIGSGEPGRETPTGMWIVKKGGKMIKPDWYDEEINKSFTAKDPEYPLGERWIELEGQSGNAVGRKGFAIHGTNEPETIGTQSSRGCIRMFNPDVIEVYRLLEPGRSQVQVVD